MLGLLNWEWDRATYWLAKPIFPNMVEFEAKGEMYPQFDCCQDLKIPDLCNWTKIWAKDLQIGCH